MQMHKVAPAKEQFEKALSVHSSFDYAYHNLGALAYDAGQLDDAADAFHKALEINAQNFASLNDLGCVSALKGNTDEAVTLFKKSIKANPGYRLPYFNIGFVSVEHALV
jgi:tetratricopeptide (TPR) repeat protein